MKILNSRPSLCVATTYLHGSDREEAEKLGVALFNLLTRPIDSPLGFGPGIPVLSAVRADRIDATLAETTVVIPVLGANAFFLQRREALRQLKAWYKTLGAGKVLPVPLVSQWRGVESELPGKPFLSELYGDGDRRHRTLEEIVLALTRVMKPSDGVGSGDGVLSKNDNPQLFISHAKADLAHLPVAKLIHDYVVGSTTGRDFFDATELVPGESLRRQLDEAASHGVLVAIRGDAYSSRSWCQRELLTAKQRGVPTLVVEILKKGEKRSSPYAGNAPTIVWQADEPPEAQAADILLRAMVEWLRSAHFVKEGERIKTAAELPTDTTVLARAPELLDFAHGRIRSQGVVLYPDPELSVAENQVLQTAFPRLHAVTPTTAYRRFLSAQVGAGASSPLEGRQVAISISESPDVDGPDGFARQHLEDAFTFVARTLIASGAEIAYGGDFRMGGFTEPLGELVLSYNDTARRDESQFLHLYQEATADVSKAPGGFLAEIHHLAEMKEAWVPVGNRHAHPKSLYVSDMRRVMADLTMARVVVGGKTAPKLYEKDSSGYSGLYPGVLEEAWRTMLKKKPLYLLGGFGGAAGLVATLLEGGKVPLRLRSRTWSSSDVLPALAKSLRADRYFKKLKLPNSMDAMAEAVRRLGKQFRKNDAAAVQWNGLNLEENRTLFRSRDPLVLSSLILKGLLLKNRQSEQGKLKIELVHGSVTRAERLNAIAVATFKDIPLSGAGAALDRAAGGRASSAHAQGKCLVRLDVPGVDADWLCLASLGAMSDFSQEEFGHRVRRAAEETRNVASQRGFWRLGVVTFGGAVVKDIADSAKIMVDSFRGLGDQFSLTWFESDKSRFDSLYNLLNADPTVAVTTRQIDVDVVRPPVRDDALLLQVSLNQERLAVTVLPPAGTALASSNEVRFPKERLEALSQGEGVTARETPSPATLDRRGVELTRLLLGKQAEQLLAKCEGKRIVVVHDVAASQIPFEMLMHPAQRTPLATRVGLNRRLMVANASVDQLFARMQKVGQLNLLLIANPTGDLPGAEDEIKRTAAILKTMPHLVKVRTLIKSQATKEAVVDAIQHADVLHYCGHAFFNGAGEDTSGLLLAGGETLAQSDLRTLDSLPRIAFVNACEAGRVRGPAAVGEAAAAFAEFFLRSGIESYLGTYWQVSDAGAAEFSAAVYTGLAGGLTLNAAVKEARQKLLSAKSNEWANYILYGDGDFQLLNRQQ